MIEIAAVEKSYGTQKVLKNCSMTIKTGSVYGLVGLNGAGKSTLLRLIAGVLYPDHGSILIDGEPCYENPEVKEKIFFLPDEPFFGRNSTEKSIADIYACFYPKFSREAFKAYLRMFQIDSPARLGTFSKGMQRRVYLAAAFAVRPECLLIDEAFDGLDPYGRLLFKKELAKYLSDYPTSVIISSHSLRELEDVCDRYGLLKDGAIKESGAVGLGVDGVYKVRLAFHVPPSVNSFTSIKILHAEVNSKFMTLIVESPKDKIQPYFEAFKPDIMEIDELTFEEIFIYKTEAVL
jgi:ABC-2 type transport system ATP-binding protein